MVKTIDIDVDFNGIIIFDYPGILAPFGGKIEDGDNILQEFTTTDKGILFLMKVLPYLSWALMMVAMLLGFFK